MKYKDLYSDEPIHKWSNVFLIKSLTDLSQRLAHTRFGDESERIEIEACLKEIESEAIFRMNENSR